VPPSPPPPPKTDIAMRAFYSDGTNLKIDYAVLNLVAAGAWISIYRSPDGVTVDWSHFLGRAVGGSEIG
jgi:hypothetical protein